MKKNNKFYRGSVIKDILNRSSIDYESSSVRPRFNTSNLSLNKVLSMTGLTPNTQESLYKGLCLEENQFHLGNQYTLEQFILYFYNYPKGYSTEISLEIKSNINLTLQISDMDADSNTLYLRVYQTSLKEECFINTDNLKGEIKIPISSIRKLSIPNNIEWKAI